MDATHRIAAAWGREIRARREQMNLTRAQLADHLDVTRQMVRLWEEGTHAPSPRRQAELIDKLGIDPASVAQLFRAGAA